MSVLEELKKQKQLSDNFRITADREKQLGNLEESRKFEILYHESRAELLRSVDESVSLQKSIPIGEIIDWVDAQPKVIRRETGIRKLDMQLVEKVGYGKVGGFTQGNYIQWAGSRGSGKSTILLKMMTILSLSEQVGWFDFEMGKRRVREKIRPFNFNRDNLLYYGDYSRDLSSIIEEIKVLYADGVRNFVIDSTMKVEVKEAKDDYTKYSIISNKLSALTSSLGINIHIINQINATSQKDGTLGLKWGNDAEYDADYIFYILAPKSDRKDDLGMDKVDETRRFLVCKKNREDEREFSIEILKTDIFPSDIEPIYEVEYKDSATMPTI